MGFFSPQKKHSCLVLKRLMDAVRAGDLMTREVVFVERTPPLDSVAETMAQHNISGVPVVGEDGGLGGMVSERDFLNLKSSRFLRFRNCSIVRFRFAVRIFYST